MIGAIVELVIAVALFIWLSNIDSGFLSVLVLGAIGIFLFGGGWGQGK